jgi:Bax protein
MSNSHPNDKMANNKTQFPQDTPTPQSILRFGAEQFDSGDSFTILVLLVLVIGALFFRLDRLDRLDRVDRFAEKQISATITPRVTAQPVLVKEFQTAQLLEQLKTAGLWDLSDHGEVPMMFVNSYPDDFHVLEDIQLRKKLFLHTLLPTALLARHEVTVERLRLQSILAKINCSPDQVNFTSISYGTQQCLWQSYLKADEVNFVKGLCKTYRTANANELLSRVNPLPVSLILAQGALESSWGRSRFAREGNSIFGMWTWKTKGMVPLQREEGKTHKVKAYDSILDSIRAYQLTLNRLDHYEHLRNLRLETYDSLVLAEGLSLYSERGVDYVNDIKKVILSNNLQSYDQYTLKGFEGDDSLRDSPKMNTAYQAAKVSL